MISLQSITKSFGTFQALDGVNLEVPAGTVQGLLGPNGAGKTTTVRVLTTLLEPDGGDASIAGHSVRTQGDAARRSLGVSGQYAAVDDKLTGLENLTLVGQLYGMRRRAAKARAQELLEHFRLDGVPMGQRAGSYSGGMRRRLDLAGALVARPPVVILDEPTTGLDPRGRRDTWDAISALAEDGTAVLLTTQYLEEADELADSIAVIDGGRIVAEGTPAALKAQAGGSHIDLAFELSDAVPAARAALSRIGLEVTADDLSLRLSATAPRRQESLQAALNALAEAQIEVVEASLRQPTLDDVFLKITQRPAGVRAVEGSATGPSTQHFDAPAREEARP
ncbi:ATP-binding cassette domain-containing protein [Nesterenkonia cremea]|uniref:Daunorubicin resistance protein DrrA family ABC transporter ATP-binding protein n=1 Tax=Nesterenkonia cremea TaxID=1882340 RepID=A0A917ALU0_9MICC|nr:ATP-binding cassette domain-containing protein [Nesterenkonia cremea]GGE59787.1 daunorubicin resistance protein DrrA family ABC transporter ATP-binding protein [Nesterenkonia cremea]